MTGYLDTFIAFALLIKKKVIFNYGSFIFSFFSVFFCLPTAATEGHNPPI